MRDKLTKKQSEYVRELRRVFAILDLDFENIRDYPEAEERIAHLQRMLHHVIRGEVIIQFTLIDALLTHKLAGRILSKKKLNLSRNKRFKALKKSVAQSRLPILRKLELLRQFTRISSAVNSYIRETTRIRNIFAHDFFLDVIPAKLRYKNKNVFSAAGVELLRADFERTVHFFIEW
jgi:hypothetical protein